MAGETPTDQTVNFLTVTDEADTLKEADKPADKKDSKEKAKPDAKPADKADKSKDKPDPDKKDDDDPAKKKPEDTDDDEADGTSGKRHQRRFERRAARLTKRAKTAEERASKAEADLQTAQAELATLKNQSTKPKAEDFDKHEDYEKALEKWTEGKQKPAAKKAAKPGIDPEFEEALAEVTDSFEDGKKKYPDFDKVVKDDKLRITDVMIMAMADADDPAEIAYHLGKHPEEAARIAELSPLRQAKAIAKIEATLAAKAGDEKADDDKDPDKKDDKSKKDDKPPKTISKAPPPVNALKGSDQSEKKLEDMDFAEFEAARANKGKPKSFW